MKNLVLIVAILFLAQDVARAQQRGFFWNGYSWEWRGEGPPTRGYPPGPEYQGQIPLRDLNCRGQSCVDESHTFGGRPKPMCASPRGPIPCY